MVFATLLWLGSNSYWQCASHKSLSICWCGVSCADSPAASCILATYPNASKSARNKSISTRPQSATETQAGLKERFCACDQLNKAVPTRTSRAAHMSCRIILGILAALQVQLCLVSSISPRSTSNHYVFISFHGSEIHSMVRRSSVMSQHLHSTMQARCIMMCLWPFLIVSCLCVVVVLSSFRRILLATRSWERHTLFCAAYLKPTCHGQCTTIRTGI